MLLRRMLLFASLLLVMGAIASAISPRERKATAPPRTAQAPGTGIPDRAAAARRVDANLPGRPVRLKVGDIVTLHVAAPGPEQVSIPDLGLFEPADADLPAEFHLVADQAGRYPVMLGLAGRQVGMLEVTSRR
jgi:hypothetical protein